MTIKEAFELLKWDFRVNRGWSLDVVRARILLTDIRIEQYLYRRFFTPKSILRFIYLFYRVFGAFLQWFVGSSSIPGSVTIGKGLRLPHPQNIIVAAYADIGEFCSIYQNVSIIWNGFQKVKPHSPKIGSRVLIGTGAIVVGDLEIGSDVLIGAGALVTRSVPDHSKVLNEPAKISPWNPTEDAAEPGSERHLRDPYSIWR
jgi:serine acetyltransferase